MADLKITIPDEKAENVIDVLSKRFGYQDMIMDGATEIPNPMTKANFIKYNIIQYLKIQYREAKADEAVNLHQNDLDDLT